MKRDGVLPALGLAVVGMVIAFAFGYSLSPEPTELPRQERVVAAVEEALEAGCVPILQVGPPAPETSTDLYERQVEGARDAMGRDGLRNIAGSVVKVKNSPILLGFIYGERCRVLTR